MKHQYILGINSAYHESAAALIKDGKLIAAAEEERFTRIKHAKEARVDNPDELPFNAINYCLDYAGITLEDIEHIGYSFYPERRLKNIGISNYFEEESWGSKEGEELFYKKLKSIPKKLEDIYGVSIKNKFHWIEHHLAHAASVFFVSQYKESPIVIIDGIGEIATCWLGYGKENKIFKIKETQYPHSLGFLWEKMSEFLGMSEYDAGKVMGLASYGDWKVYFDDFHKIISYNDKDIFKIDNEIMRFRTNDFSEIEKVFGLKKNNGESKLTKEYQNIAAAMQKITENVVLRIIDYTDKKAEEYIKINNLCCAGGVMLNCIANATYLTRPYESVFIPSAPHDAGTAIGSAFYIYNQILNNKRKFIYEHAYWGPEYNNKEIEELLVKYNLEYKQVENIEKKTAKFIADGSIVIWYQGRMEFGPRALGNRSFLADPRRSEMRDIINQKVKKREWFRPFAPSVPEENMKDFFYIRKYLLADRFMVFAVMTKYPEKIPAVTHVDETSRVQTVSEDTNPKYYKLLKEFEKITKIPILLNTSYNVQEPIVCTPEDAIQTFLKTKVDYLIISNYIVSVKSKHLQVLQNIFNNHFRTDDEGIREVLVIGNERIGGCPYSCIGCGVHEDAEISTSEENRAIISEQIINLEYRIQNKKIKYTNQGYHLSVYNYGNITNPEELSKENLNFLFDGISNMILLPKYVSLNSRGTYINKELLYFIKNKQLKYNVNFIIGVESMTEKGSRIYGKPGIKGEFKQLFDILSKFNDENKTNFGLDVGFVFLPEFYTDNRKNIQVVKNGFENDLDEMVNCYVGKNVPIKITIHPFFKIPNLPFESTENFMDIIKEVADNTANKINLINSTLPIHLCNSVFIGTLDAGYETEMWQNKLDN